MWNLSLIFSMNVFVAESKKTEISSDDDESDSNGMLKECLDSEANPFFIRDLNKFKVQARSQFLIKIGCDISLGNQEPWPLICDVVI